MAYNLEANKEPVALEPREAITFRLDAKDKIRQNKIKSWLAIFIASLTISLVIIGGPIYFT